MRTSERKNRKRLKALADLKRSDLKQYEEERERLRRTWKAEVWRRVRRRDLPPAATLIRTAALFDLEDEIASEVVRAVDAVLCGPAFTSHSVTFPRSNDPDTIARWCESHGPAGSGRKSRAPNAS